MSICLFHISFQYLYKIIIGSCLFMDDILVLEDNPTYRHYIREYIPSHLRATFVENSAALRRYLGDGMEARLYFLDDQVPEAEGAAADFHFIDNSLYLLGKKPDARIFYVGSIPQAHTRTFCFERGIKIVLRNDIEAIIASELGANK